MRNPFPLADNNKRYYTLDYHLKQRFGCKVMKISLNAGFTCPNIDGTKGVGGCIYCDASGSGEFAGNVCDPLAMQFEDIKGRMHQKWDANKYIAYFQAFTNTYAPVDCLRQLYNEALSFENVVGLFIATRADCLPDEVVELLREINRRTYLVVELGLQSVSDKTGALINRGHTFDEFMAGYEELRSAGINIGVHIINGLPGETREDMLDTVRTIAPLGMHSIKIHLLHVLRDTKLAEMYARGEFGVMSLTDYVGVVCDQLELLPATTIIQRVTGDGGRDELIAPLWSLKKFAVMNEIDKEMVRRNSYQGKHFK